MVAAVDKEWLVVIGSAVVDVNKSGCAKVPAAGWITVVAPPPVPPRVGFSVPLPPPVASASAYPLVKGSAVVVEAVATTVVNCWSSPGQLVLK